AAAVEVGEKRVVALVEHGRRLEPGGQPPGERGLADADRSLDCDVLECHGLRSSRSPRSRMLSSRTWRETQGSTPEDHHHEDHAEMPAPMNREPRWALKLVPYAMCLVLGACAVPAPETVPEP